MAVLVALQLVMVPAGAHAAQNCAPAEENVIAEPSWAQSRIAPERAWPLTEGSRQLVGIVDTGVSAGAPALAGAVLPGTDLGTGRGDTDCSGHGTFLGGLLAARPRAGTKFAGVAPGARVLPVRVTDNPAQVDAARLAKGVRAAVDGGATIVAVGLTTSVDDGALRSEVANAVARGVVIVASVATPQQGQRSFPAALPGVLAVAPLVRTPAAGNVRLGADPVLAAPSEALVSIAPAGQGHRRGSAPELAVAYVAGAAALVRDYHPDLSAAGVAERLRTTADRQAGAVPNPLTGFGVVDPVAAVTSVPVGTGTARKSSAEQLNVPVAIAPDAAPVHRALWFAGVLLVATLLVGASAGLRALGRLRGGENPTAAGSGPSAE
ncbi:S8 family serine peptidase [Lentzea roselyniae]|uniref:S8 family serine peptidase n=1 Tax=Lentzea roselyniae TaxID=531940 RepID=A0ABP7C633_9PSEU